MSTYKRFTYVDFRQEPVTTVLAKATHAVATGGDNQEDYTRVGSEGHYFEWIQTGQNDVIFPVASATGWKLPMDTATDGIEITQGIVAGDPTAMKFVVGTDAFYIKVKAEITTLANFAHFGVGFRELAAYTDIGNAAAAITAYDEKIMLKAVVTSGITSYTSSVAGADASATVLGSPIATGVAFTWEIHVDLAGVCTAKVDGVVDTTFNAAALTQAATTVLIPSISFCGNATGASSVELVTYECGLE